MFKRLGVWLMASVIVMLLLPQLTVTFVKGDAGMAVCFLLFYALNPLYAICTGVMAEKQMREGWSLPLITSALFLLGAWLFFEWGEMIFILYSAIYLLLGYTSMLVARFVKRIQQKPFR